MSVVLYYKGKFLLFMSAGCKSENKDAGCMVHECVCVCIESAVYIISGLPLTIYHLHQGSFQTYPNISTFYFHPCPTAERSPLYLLKDDFMHLWCTDLFSYIYWADQSDVRYHGGQVTTVAVSENA